MSLRNNVNLIGFVGKDPEIIQFENGTIKANTTLATHDYYINSTGEKVEETQWHKLVAYGKTAEIMQQHIKKGKEIAIRGKITYRSYEKEEQKISVTEIRVEEILLL